LLELSSFKHDYQPLLQDVAEAVHPIYTDLSNKKLLERCIGFTQNNNESYNQLIWKITPKIVPCGSKIVEMAAYIAVILYECNRAFTWTQCAFICRKVGCTARHDLRQESAREHMRRKNGSQTASNWIIGNCWRNGEFIIWSWNKRLDV